MINFEFLDHQAAGRQAACSVFAVAQEKGEAAFDHVKKMATYQRLIAPLVQASNFLGEEGSLVKANGVDHSGKVLLIGLGKKEAITGETIRHAAALMYKQACELYTDSVWVYFDGFLDQKAHLQAFVEGVLLAAHVDHRFKSPSNRKQTGRMHMVLVGVAQDQATVLHAQHIIQGVCLARELVNAPANHLTPTTLAATAQQLADQYALQLNILEEEDCKKLGMGAYLSVTQGSDEPPKFIHLTYKPAVLDPDARFQKIALIGKGVTFDSGGLNLKVGSQAQIECMKYDMAGAAAVLGIAQAVALLKPNKEIHFIIAATENMINGKATRPGDVVQASNGKTIEINNTDAEGRLTLADALVYAEKLHVDAIVDLATLTGAIVVALGERIAGLFGGYQPLVDQLILASRQSGEKVWPMPLEAQYLPSMHSITADLSNVADKRGGGSITAALFLQQFVQDTPWVHIDIAGPVFTKKAYGYHHAGGTGFGVRLLVEWLLNS